MEISPDLETLINKRLSTGAYANAEEVVRHALEAQEAQNEELDPEFVARIEEGLRQAERGEVTDGEQAFAELQEMKEAWRLSRKSA